MSDAHERVDPLAAAAARVGDRWSLVLIDALLGRPRRFNDLLESLPGLAPNVLSRRLKHLEHEGLIVARAYSQRPVRNEYELTDLGADLASVLRLLAEWGANHTGSSEPVTHARCGTPLEARWYCPTCENTVDDPEADELDYA